MNLNCYDNVKEQVDKTKTWLIPQSKTLSTHEMRYRPWSCVLQRYNDKTYHYTYYIAMINARVPNKNCVRNYNNPGGRIRISLKEIWDKSSLRNVTEETNTRIKLVDEQDDGEIYELLDI